MLYSREKLIDAVSSQMPAKRWEHTQGVMETAVILAGRFGADPVKAELAAILHDVAKYWPVQRLHQMMVDHKLSEELLHYDKQLWHAEVGAFVAQQEYGVTDAQVLDAIRYHTSGRIGMTLLDKVVCLADYMEPGRDFPGVNNIRELANHSLEEALAAGFDSTIGHLLSRRQIIYPLTVLARNDLIKQLEANS
ncbi:metal dependent phosphohydrolase [Paenibacillus vortex V453]|jgi:predicted HD superfamily hydrolase involved in NAD metabolism|uniref:bis(5'-nucleosyl)-tetraphosphatase (symmetrical) n=2 Tax=Paenibacillus TaxID=44249 RepID=A0A163KXM6_9BACL|nr:MULTISPECIES: bis(5'-nucleosyl)-tetraphosphatase (symmetrical) YqeK [Paenibacillus]ANA81582.1 phosphohydrolase [Paenibacillus glucanolyticus]AVV59687.1 HD domain-containing protein [Paenibacillus glucanolyticus]EFU42007.1 metal dependent phosphohydrolase [Paenibacillus vortex V453]ETT30384.1 metal dependent phosphohydrolase [Paenibacillus sp. FSL R5-808]KZS47626.1 phosphohydrolase [Paenibacillus glucanolyticus]